MWIKGRNKMKSRFSSIKIHLVIMIVLYAGTWLIFNDVVLKQQHRTLDEYKNQRAKLEYDYLRIKNYPDYIETIKSSLQQANTKLKDFLWLTDGYDPNLVLFRHIVSIADSSHIEIIGLEPIDKNDEKYYYWNISFKGDISGILRLINGIEKSRKFLKIESTEISKSEDGISVVIIVSGLKKLG